METKKKKRKSTNNTDAAKSMYNLVLLDENRKFKEIFYSYLSKDAKATSLENLKRLAEKKKAPYAYINNNLTREKGKYLIFFKDGIEQSETRQFAETPDFYCIGYYRTPWMSDQEPDQSYKISTNHKFDTKEQHIEWLQEEMLGTHPYVHIAIVYDRFRREVARTDFNKTETFIHNNKLISNEIESLL